MLTCCLLSSVGCQVAETLRIKGLTETDGKPKSSSSECDGHARESSGTDVAPVPPLISAAAAPTSAVTPASWPAPAAAAPASAAAWAPPPPTATKRRSPEPSHERDEPGTPPREQTAGGHSAKRRKSRAPVQAAPAAAEPEQPEPQGPLELEVKQEPAEEPMEQPAETARQPEQEVRRHGHTGIVDTGAGGGAAGQNVNTFLYWLEWLCSEANFLL